MAQLSANDLQERFLAGMGRAACTVNVVTTDGPAGCAGVTVSAMASVSMEGPTLLVCVHHKSPAAAAILENGVFCVNVLRDDQSHIADTFAGRLPPSGGDKFTCAEWVGCRSGAPRVADALTAFDCRLFRSDRVGTHEVLFGTVEDIWLARSGTPLVYARRGYGSFHAAPRSPTSSRPDRAA